MEPVIVSGLVWIPYRYYTPQGAADLMKRLTVVPRGYQGAVRTPISYWRKSNARRLVGLPVEFGMGEVARLGISEHNIVEDLSEGEEAIFPAAPTPRDAAQAAFFSDTIVGLSENYTLFAMAPTGTGKTVCILNAVAVYQRTTLIVVDTVVIADQWADEIKKHLGLKDEDIGWVKGPVCNYQGKRIVIAIVHNLVQKEFPEAFYRYFGFVGWDEGQILGAESFSQSMALFPARFRVTVSATPKRKDGTTKMIYDYFGSPRVITTQEALPCHVEVIPYHGVRYNSKMPMAVTLTHLSQESNRNRLIVQQILSEWSLGAPFLCVSARVEQLQYLMEWCAQSGIPRSEMGLFTRSFTNEEGKVGENTKPYLDWCKREAKVIFATYQMFDKAVDVPRLVSGIDATPRASAIQLLGRVRRTYPDKFSSRWFTIQDTNNPQLMNTFRGRLKEYKTDRLITVSYRN